MSPSDPSAALRAKWDRRYSESTGYPLPSAVLADNLHLLPRSGRALDLACGLGAGALLLAQQGLQVIAWDLSAVAIERLRKESRARGLKVLAQVRDVCEEPPENSSFDVILVSHFLDRGLSGALSDALRPGGLLFYQTFTREAVTERGPADAALRLARNELLALFPSLIVRLYREDGRVGDRGRGLRDVAQLIAQLPDDPR